MVNYTAAHYRIGFCTWPTLRGAKHFYSTSTTVSSFTRPQRMIGRSSALQNQCLHMSLRGAKHFNSCTSYFCMNAVYILPTNSFCVLLHKSNTDETQTPNQFSNNYGQLESIIQEHWITQEIWRFVKSIRHLKQTNKKVGSRCASYKKSIQIIYQQGIKIPDTMADLVWGTL